MGSELQQRFVWHLLRIIALVLAGTFGFLFVEHWRFLDALYMTVITLTTVGYGEVQPLSDAGRIYAIVLILTGVGVVLYILSDMVSIFLEANPTAIFGRRRMRQKIARLSGHQILCGYGRTGQEVANHFQQNKVSFVVIDLAVTAVKRAEESGLTVLQGDASSDEALLAAGIERAKGIVCALPDDTSNTFIALSAKGLNESIAIVARAANPGSAAKLKRAGANMVISPYIIGGRRMAAAVTHPLVTEFLDVIMHCPQYDLRMEQIAIAKGSEIIDTTLKNSNIKQVSGSMILAVYQDGKLITNPSSDLVFKEGNELIALGTEEGLKKLVDLAGAHTT